MLPSKLLAFRTLCLSLLLSYPDLSESSPHALAYAAKPPISNTSIAWLLVICGFIDQPITCGENRTHNSGLFRLSPLTLEALA